MCQYTQATVHGCGHPRTAALVTKCNDSQLPGRKCTKAKPSPQVIADSKCWPYLQAQMGSQQFRSFLLDQLVIPETSELEADRGREDWMDIHRRERQVRLTAKAAASAASVEQESALMQLVLFGFVLMEILRFRWSFVWRAF